uniref:Uncharacterized protein n=1 Tax=Knipowitschia caucasica TaxID=637954 RepID=A0AAV2JCT3_KNICA
MKEMEQLQLQAAAQRDELQAQIEKTRDDESFLRDHLSISVKENRRLETELLDTTEKLVAAENQIANLQTNIENIMKEKFGDLDPGSAEFFLQEERIKQLHLSYEVQCRELQDRIDELQSELNDFHCISRDHQLNSKTLNEELESKSPGNESDPGLGSEEVQPFSLSLEAEMMLEQLKDRHLQEMDELRKQMEHKISEFEEIVEKQRASQEERRVSIHQQHKDERDALRDEISRVQSRAEELQTRLDQVLTDPPNLKPDMDNELQTFQEEEIQTLRQQLLESHIKNADLDEQLKNLEEQLKEMLKLVKEHEDKEAEMKAQFELEKEQIQQKCEDGLLERLHQQTMEFELRERKLKGECDMEKAQLEEDFEGMVQERVREELEKMAADRDEEDKRFEQLMREERDKIHQQHQETVKELMQRHQKEREELHGTLDKLKEDIASERRQIASGFGLRLKQLEERFEMDQEQVAERFQADILKLEQNYQNELKATYKNHEAERHQWEEETSAILGRERSKMTEEWTKEMDVMVSKNNRLQSELDEIVRCNELEETDLRKQIAELQEGLEMREKFLSDVQKQAMESEEMLKETVQILQDERNELMKSQFEIEAKYKEVVGISEQQIAERIELLTERDDSKVKIEELERSMAKIQALEDNYSLKVKLLLFTEHIKELERKAFQMADLQIRYEDCACENSKLKEQNAELEKRVWSLESSLNIHGSPVTLADDIHRMRRENGRLSELLVELETPPGNLLMKRKKSRESTQPIQSGLHQLREDLEDRCCDFKLENAKLQRAMTDLQDQSHLLTKTSTVHRSEAYRLSEENLHLNKKINALKEDDLKDLMKTLATLKEEKDASERAADDYKKQISELQSQSVLLGNRNGILCEKNSQHLCDVEALKQQVAALAETKDQTKSEDKTQLSACVSALEAEMTKAANETASLKLRNSLLSQEVGKLREKLKSLESMENQMQTLSEEKNNLVKESQALCSQISKAQEKAKASEEALQAVTLQNSRLKADVRVLQQQKDTLQHEVALLHKKLQNTTEKNHVLERALHSTGLQSHSKKLLREELSRLMEQEQKLLKQENDKLQTEVLNAKAELRQARDKFRQMDSTIVSLKQHKQNQSAMLLTLEQENLTLKEELEAQKEKNKGREAGAAGPDTESILQENEALKSQMSRLSTQLIETFQAQLVGLLPPSPHRTPRGQQLREREEAENAQGAVPDQRGAHADSYRRIGGL